MKDNLSVFVALISKGIWEGHYHVNGVAKEGDFLVGYRQEKEKQSKVFRYKWDDIKSFMCEPMSRGK